MSEVLNLIRVGQEHKIYDWRSPFAVSEVLNLGWVADRYGIHVLAWRSPFTVSENLNV